MKLVDRHPLGFVKVSLRLPGGWRIRLHYWAGVGSDAPHAHRWTFWSVPLLGRFADIRWDAAPGRTHQRVTAWPPGPDGRRRYQPTGQYARLIQRRQHLRRPFLPYRCPRGDIHTYTPIGRGPHLTVVLLAPARDHTSDMWQEERP